MAVEAVNYKLPYKQYKDITGQGQTKTSEHTSNTFSQRYFSSINANIYLSLHSAVALIEAVRNVVFNT